MRTQNNGTARTAASILRMPHKNAGNIGKPSCAHSRCLLANQTIWTGADRLVQYAAVPAYPLSMKLPAETYL